MAKKNKRFPTEVEYDEAGANATVTAPHFIFRAIYEALHIDEPRVLTNDEMIEGIRITVAYMCELYQKVGGKDFSNE